MTNDEIELISRNLLNDMWKVRDELLPDLENVTHHDILDPVLICKFLKVNIAMTSDLNNVVSLDGKIKVKTAGVINRKENQILISTDLRTEVARFTAAHEIAHYMLHNQEIEYHRDIPIDSASYKSHHLDRVETEANHFSGCVLIPEALLIKEIQSMFMVSVPITFDDQLAFLLNQNESNALLRASCDSLDREFALAACKSFNGYWANSLAEKFGVSDKAMAIRIKQLKLVRWP